MSFTVNDHSSLKRTLRKSLFSLEFNVFVDDKFELDLISLSINKKCICPIKKIVLVIEIEQSKESKVFVFRQFHKYSFSSMVRFFFSSSLALKITSYVEDKENRLWICFSI
jgi:hypothetical protein